jgi:hypothetical protein
MMVCWGFARMVLVSALRIDALIQYFRDVASARCFPSPGKATVDVGYAASIACNYDLRIACVDVIEFAVQHCRRDLWVFN